MRNADSNDDEQEVKEEEETNLKWKLLKVSFWEVSGSIDDKENIFVGRLSGGGVIFARDIKGEGFLVA